MYIIVSRPISIRWQEFYTSHLVMIIRLISNNPNMIRRQIGLRITYISIYCNVNDGENRPHLCHTFHRIYMTSILWLSKHSSNSAQRWRSNGVIWIPPDGHTYIQPFVSFAIITSYTTQYQWKQKVELSECWQNTTTQLSQTHSHSENIRIIRKLHVTDLTMIRRWEM